MCKNDQPVELSQTIRLVKQNTDCDCVPACLAMVSGMTLEAVIEAVGNLYVPGKGIAREAIALGKLGFPKGSYRKYDLTDWQDPERFKWLIWGRTAIITVKSMNIDGGFHCIVYDGETIYDPSKGKTYTSFEEIEPLEAVIFQERSTERESGKLALLQEYYDASEYYAELDRTSLHADDRSKYYELKQATMERFDKARAALTKTTSIEVGVNHG